MKFLSARGLTKRYGGLVAVNNVDFDLAAGEVRALIGPNGAGKTTLVGLICGRIPATAGHVWFRGRDVTRLPAHKRVALGMAYTFQVTSIYARLPVRENVALAVRRHLQGGERFIRAAIDEALARVGLSAYADMPAGELSYGHQRLLEIAMGIGQAPRLLILDEPTQGLADSEIAGFLTLLEQLVETTTILLIEHNLDVVMQAAHRITVMDAGRILAEGSPEEIRANPAVQAAYLGVSDA